MAHEEAKWTALARSYIKTQSSSGRYVGTTSLQASQHKALAISKHNCLCGSQTAETL